MVFFSTLKYLYFVDVMYLPEPKTVRNYRRFCKCVSHPQKMATSDFGCEGNNLHNQPNLQTLIITLFLIHKMGRQHYLFTKGLLVIYMLGAITTDEI